jgi:hypothetical protein
VILGGAERALAAAVWQARADAEHEAGASFALVARRFTGAGGDRAIADRLAAAAADEARHAAACADLAAVYRADEARAPAGPPFVEPIYPGVTPQLSAILHVVSLCAIGETIAVAALEAAHGPAEGAPRETLRLLLRDEIEHARIGWALLATLDAATRAEVARRKAALIEANRRAWLTPRPGARPAIDLPAHGCLSAATVERVVEAAVRELVLPGFAHVGM